MTTCTPNRVDPHTALVLGSYRIGATERILYARSKGSWTYITDEPAVSGSGDIYPVDQIPDSDGQGAVAALAADYLSEARNARTIPMSRTIIDTPETREAA